MPGIVIRAHNTPNFDTYMYLGHVVHPNTRESGRLCRHHRRNLINSGFSAWPLNCTPIRIGSDEDDEVVVLWIVR